MCVCKCMCIYVKMYIEVLSVVRGPMCMLKKSMLLCAPRNSLCIHSYFPEHHACSEAQYSLQKQITDIPLKGVGGEKRKLKEACLVKYFMVPTVGIVRRFSLVEMELELTGLSSALVGKAPPPTSVTD